MLADGGIRGIRFSISDPRNASTSVEMIEPLSKRVNALGWHVQINMTAVQIVEAEDLWNRLPGLRQTPIWRRRTRLALLGLLHASRSHLQSSSGGAGGWAGHLSLARLGPPQQETLDAVAAGRISAAILPSRAAPGLRAHSPFWVLRPSPATCPPTPLLCRAPSGRSAHCRDRVSSRSRQTCLVLPSLWRPDGDHGAIHRSRTTTPRSSRDDVAVMICSLTSRVSVLRERLRGHSAPTRRNTDSAPHSKFPWCYSYPALPPYFLRIHICARIQNA